MTFTMFYNDGVVYDAFTVEGKDVEVFFAAPKAKTVLLLSYEKEGQAIYDALCALCHIPFNLVVVSGMAWNDDLSPWPHGPIFKGDPGYRGKADDFLSFVGRMLWPMLEQRHAMTPVSTAVAGYSLAGLFALYSGFHTDRFDGLLSISGSLWFPGFAEYVQTHSFRPSVRLIDLSLGDKEAQTKNLFMKSVAEKTTQIADILQKRALDCSLTWNPGGHFQDVTKRTAEALSRYVNHP